MKNFKHFSHLAIFFSFFVVCGLSAQTRSNTVDCDPIDPEAEYYIKHVETGLYLKYQSVDTRDGCNFCISPGIVGDDAFKFTFTEVEVEDVDSVYNIGTNGGYLNNDAGWRVVLGQAVDVNGSIKIASAGTDDCSVTFSGLWNNKYFNLDEGNPWVYGDKNSGAKWILEKVSVEVAPCNPIKTGVDYYIKNIDTESYMQYYPFENTPDLCEFRVTSEVPAAGDNSFKFSFIKVAETEDVYNIATNGGYINNSAGWRLVLGDTVDDDGSVRIVEGLDCSLVFSGLWNNKYFNINDGNPWIYGDKTTGARWILEEIGATSIDLIKKSKNVNVYPTLSKGEVTISTPQAATIKVIDLSGKVLAKYISNGTITINTNYANGIYFIRVESDSVETHKVILQK